MLNLQFREYEDRFELHQLVQEIVFRPLLPPAFHNLAFKLQAVEFWKNIRETVKSMQLDPDLAKRATRVFFCRPYGGISRLVDYQNPGQSQPLKGSCKVAFCPHCYARRVLDRAFPALMAAPEPFLSIQGLSFNLPEPTFRELRLRLLTARREALRLLASQRVDRAILGCRLQLEPETGIWQNHLFVLRPVHQAPAPSLKLSSRVDGTPWSQQTLYRTFDNVRFLAGQTLGFWGRLLYPEFRSLLVGYLAAVWNVPEFAFLGIPEAPAAAAKQEITRQQPPV